MKNNAMIPLFEENLHSKNWQNELRNGIKDKNELLKLLDLQKDPRFSEKDASELFPTRVPMPFIQRMQKGDINDPLLLQVLANATEFTQNASDSKDPLKEQNGSAPLLQKYQSRVLIILTASCAINCRYCFRRHFPYRDFIPGSKGIENIIEYINNDSAINEVILSGGEPLLVEDHYLQRLLQQICQRTQVKRIRIHSRMPVVIPSRITFELKQLLSKLPVPVIVVFHINHPNEIDNLVSEKVKFLQNNNLTLLNQAVLLKGINDNSEILSDLSEKLFEIGILPYYLHQMDQVSGATHFNVDDEKAVKIMAQLLKILPGFLVPKLVREVPGFDSKLPLDLDLLKGF